MVVYDDVSSKANEGWGGTQDALLLRQTAGSFRAVLAGKVSGLFTLDAALAAAPLCAMMLFSSVSSILAPLGQPNYAAANAVLNAWASARSEQARRTCASHQADMAELLHVAMSHDVCVNQPDACCSSVHQCGCPIMPPLTWGMTVEP